MRSGADTTFKDKDGNAIKVHCYVADDSDTRYYINSFCQAVPTGEGAATPLEDLVKSHELRVLTPEEVLKVHAAKNGVSAKKAAAAAAKSAAPEKPARKVRMKVLKPAAEQPDPKPAEGPKNDPKPAKHEEVRQEEINAEMEMLLQAFPAKMLAAELRRRGFVFSAVKPVVIEI